MANKKFSWNEGLVVDTFNLKRVDDEQMLLLVDWLNTNEDLNNIDFDSLEKLRIKAKLKIDAWNEEELKMNYLSFIVNYANYSDDLEYNVYFERPIIANVEGTKINVIVDFMIAQGVRDLVKKPYFCFHEYKREKNITTTQ